ncbi:MAG TPA: hypothetical protein VMT37_02830 [Solirubrobacterales bacterium]|nr:hypothetical protein [Solirubrobacterales bacterium]
MNRFKKLALTIAALAALAVGGAAFAQAQNAGTAAPTQVQTRSVETGTPGDPADAPSAEDRSEADGSAVDAPESKADQPDGNAVDAPESHADQPD